MPDPFSLLNSHIPVSREIFVTLERYHSLLLLWQKKINLVADSTIENAWSRHFLDSLQLVKFLPDKKKRVMDLGSGAGFPGMVLSLCGYDDVHLIESDGKKIAFLKEVARITKSGATIHHCRIEDCPSLKPDIIIARACSPLGRLLKYSSPHVSHETICLFPKGKNYSKEIKDAEKTWRFGCDIFPSSIDNQSVILRLSNIKEKAA